MRANSMDIFAAEPDETLLDKNPRDIKSRIAALYHNQPFDSSHLSHEFLFARFAWAILKWARTAFTSHPAADRKAFNLKNCPCCSEEVRGRMMEMGTNGLTHYKTDITGKRKETGNRKRPDSPGFKDPAARDAHELDEDSNGKESCTVLSYVPKAGFYRPSIQFFSSS